MSDRISGFSRQVEDADYPLEASGRGSQSLHAGQECCAAQRIALPSSDAETAIRLRLGSLILTDDRDAD